MLVLILGTGLFLTVGLKLMPLRRLGYGFRQLWQGRKDRGEEGDITPFNALMTSLSATIGTGNIAGVATAIFLGGPGALFWMWCTALVGMATKYAEAVLAVRYREVDERGNHVGGPMYYIKNGLDGKWVWLGTAFAIFGALAGFGIGNTVQANQTGGASLGDRYRHGRIGGAGADRGHPPYRRGGGQAGAVHGDQLCLGGRGCSDPQCRRNPRCHQPDL
jgi:AGCS family alanine or glycine:cation symporter